MPNPERMFFIRLYTACFLVGGLLASWLAWGSDQVFADGFESPDRDYCDDPLIMPAGRTMLEKPWDRIWSSPFRFGAQATYPNSIGSPVPVGAQKQGYTVVPFIPRLGETVTIYWEPVQSQGSGTCARQPEGCRTRPAEGMTFTISPCPGDFRQVDFISTDGFLQAGCRRGGSMGGMFYHTIPTLPSSFMACQLQAGQTYFMNILAAALDQASDPNAHSCAPHPNTGQGCDVQATSRGN